MAIYSIFGGIMKKVKRLFLLTFTFIALFFLFACGGGGDDGKRCEGGCVDKNLDGACDACKKEMIYGPIEDLELVTNGAANFQIVLAENAPSDIRMALDKNIVKPMKTNSGITVKLVAEGSAADTPQDIEVLVGTVTSRGDEYSYLHHIFGADGYMIRIIGKKVVITAGSEDAMLEAIDEFASILKANAKNTDSVVMTEADMKLKFTDGYEITLLRINGADMRGYVIATDLENKLYRSAAEKMRDEIYGKTGYYFEVVSASAAAEKAIYINKIDKVSGPESFRAVVSGNNLTVSCAYDNLFNDAMDEFIETAITGRTGAVNLTGTLFEKDISVVYYEDFGACGDGVTDDFKAFYDTHVFANGGGQTVEAAPGRTYYLCDSKMGGTSPKSIPIRTNVNWNGATVIIDDTATVTLQTHENYLSSKIPVFEVLPDEEHEMVEITARATLNAIVKAGLKPGTTEIDLGLEDWDGPVMIVPRNSKHRVFRRKGYSQFKGEIMHEILLVSADGKISDTTPVMFDYTFLNSIYVYKLDPSSAITVENGNIHTLSSKINHMIDGEFVGGYTERGIKVTRSYTTVKNIKHTITEGISLKERVLEGKEGPSSSGFFKAENAHTVTFKDCIIPGRMCYANSSSYNFRALCVNEIVLDGCIQPNFWVTVDKSTYSIINVPKGTPGAYLGMQNVDFDGTLYRLQWGIGGTNYCKNMKYINSTLTRLDAHAGLYNGVVSGSNIITIALTGGGDFLVENSDVYSPATGNENALFTLRTDYGSTWDGDIAVKDSRFHVDTSLPTYVAGHAYQNWYFGYTVVFPNFTLDNLTVLDVETGQPVSQKTEIQLFALTAKKLKMHLHNSGQAAYFSIVDDDGDGYVDEPLYDVNLDGKINEDDKYDADGDGKIGNTSIKYDAAMATASKPRAGIRHYDMKQPNVTVNLCLVKPPEYFKVVNNTAGHRYTLLQTDGQGISDGGWYRDSGTADTMGGFFGGTKFYYGNSSYFTGTNPSAMPQNSTFVIKTPQ